MADKLSFTKQNNNLLLNHLPSSANGTEADISISSLTSKGIYLSAKTGGQWYATKLQNAKDLDNGRFRDLRVDGIATFHNPNTTFRQGFTSLSDIYIRGSQKLYMGTSTTTNISGSSDSIVYTYDDNITEKLTMTLSGDMVLDKNYTGTTTSTEKVIYIDFDATAIVASGQTLTNIGLDLDMNCESVTHVGNIVNTGIDIDMVAATDGFQTNTGINITTSGGDNNLGLSITSTDNHIKLIAAADFNDYAMFALADTADLTISTVGSGTTDSDLTLDIDGDIELNADAGNIHFKDGLGYGIQFDISNKRHTYFYDLNNYYRITIGANAITTISTLDSDGTAGHLLLKPNGILKIAADDGGMSLKEIADAGTDTAGFGQLWVHDDAPNVLMFTDDTGIDAHISEKLATWGGGLARTTGANGKWLGIPCTGHQAAVISFGTDSAAPDTSLNVTTTADDLCGVIWQPLHIITVSACRIHYAQGGATNTRHSVCLMRYDIDADGTLSNGVEVAGVDADGGSDDYTTLAFTDLTMTSDVAVTSVQVLIAMVYCIDAINGAMSARCTIEYL